MILTNMRKWCGIYLRKSTKLTQSLDRLENKDKTGAFSQYSGFDQL
jgi:hypothetical protein